MQVEIVESDRNMKDILKRLSHLLPSGSTLQVKFSPLQTSLWAKLHIAE